jgi:predicted AAA+ superfamily ATPase
MKKSIRYLSKVILDLAIKRNKMAFVSGPRQVGKTTLSKSYQSHFAQSLYKNWDDTQVKREWSKNPKLLIEEFDLTKHQDDFLLILDEIHKAKNWKSSIKGLFDTHGEVIKIIVTGSARLNIYKKGSDSLMGRYLNFRLHPLSVREVHELSPLSPEQSYRLIFATKIKSSFKFNLIEQLFKYSGFPEPFFAKDTQIQNIWRKGRHEKIIREDLMDLSRIQELSQIEILCSLLPEKIGSPLSVQSLREDISASHDSLTRWLSYLRELYYFFQITTYSKSISRSIKKEPKIYFYDWTTCETNGQKFENFIASHILKACHFWTDSGYGDFELNYLRDKDKNEVDFVLIKDKKPWFTVECKFQQKTLETSYQKFQAQLKCPHIQVVYEKDVFQKINTNTWIMGVDHFLGNLV